MSQKKLIPETPNEPTPAEPIVVGIGASAGGVEALTQFFKQVTPDSGLAYVVILHLSPDYDSQLTQILQGVTRIPVQKVAGRVRILANQVYVVPPNQHLQLDDGHILALPNTQIEDRRAPVDILFRTLAESHRERAIGVILSGTGANGSMGLKRIKEQGGAVFVQNPREAAYNEMPRHAIATDLVDDILFVAEIPARLLAYQKSRGSLAIAGEDHPGTTEPQNALREVFTQLRVRTGHDFTNYKRPTMLRRIERRLSVHNLADLPAYVTFLRAHPQEIQALLKDLLISVTNFFRDSAVFTTLEHQILPLLIHGKTGEDALRIWVAGCATGEEAYSLAMLLAERTLDVADAPAVQIFATDLDETALATAREGLYSLNDAADVSPERLRRFFTQEGEQYRVRPEIREMILFAHHNVLKDPPFSRLDLVSCRNLLIYFNQTAQKRALETFHFALNPGGCLLLGLAETTDGKGDLYTPLNREHHLFQSRSVANRVYPVPEISVGLVSGLKREPEATLGPENPANGRLSYGELHHQVLEQYAPPSILVNADFDILHLSEHAGRYLQMGGGEPTRNLLQLIQPDLRLELRSAFYQAAQQRTPVVVPHLTVPVADQPQRITLHVRPVLGEGNRARGNPAGGFMLVLFEPTDEVASEPTREPTRERPPIEPVAHQLEDELMRTKVKLRLANEQHDVQAEELKAANEELQAINEELRASAEELETSQEELQSINEELTTINQELKIKVEEISLASNNLQNLINATDIATLFLDRSLRVNLFTPATRQIFNLIPADFGRPLSDITNRLAYAHLQADAEAVLSKLQPIEREVATTDGRTFIMRVLPYRTADDRINGVVITLVDITDRKRADEALRESEERKEFLLKLTDTIRQLNDPEAIQYEAARLVAEQLQADRVHFAEIREEKVVIRKDYVRGDAPSLAGVFDTLVVATAVQLDREEPVVIADIEAFPLLSDEEKGVLTAAKIRSQLSVALSKQGKKVASFSVDQTTPRDWKPLDIAILQEAAERTLAAVEKANAEAALARSEEKYRALFNSIDEGFCIIERVPGEPGAAPAYRPERHDFHYLEANPAFVTQSGVPEVVGKTIRQLVPGESQEWIDIYDRVLNTQEPIRFERDLVTVGRVLELYAFPVTGQSEQLAVVFSDITERKQRAREQEFLLRLGDALRPLSDPIAIQRTAMRVLGEQLEVDRTMYAEISPDDEQFIIGDNYVRGDVSKMTGRFPLSAFGRIADAQRAGEMTVVDDLTDAGESDEHLASYLAIGVHAILGIPLHKGGRWIASVAVHNGVPRRWTPKEVALVQETAERTWAAVERAKSEEALRESEARFRRLFTNNMVPMFVWTPAGEIVDANDAFLDLIGYSRDDLDAGNFRWDSLTPPEGHTRDAEAVTEVMTQGFCAPYEKVFFHKDGHPVPFLIGAGIFDSNKALGVCYAIDLTERKRAEAALLESEQRLAAIRPLTLLSQTEALAEVGSWEYEPSTRQFNWSEGMYRLLGLVPDEAIRPEIYLDVAVDEDRHKAQDLVTYLHEGEGHFETSFRIGVGEADGPLRRTGPQIKTLRIKAEVIGEGNQKRVLGVDLDMTEQLQARQQIQETADKLQAVLNASPAAIALLKAVHDPQQPERILDFRLVVGNQKLAQFLGTPLAELLDQSVEQLGELLWDGITLDVLRQVYHSREARYEEKPMPGSKPDRWLALSVTQEDDGVMLTGLDITELKQIQGQQGQWLNELEASRHSVDALTTLRASLTQRTELLRAVSHDLRGNFGIIQGALSLLEAADSEGDRAQMMEMVLRNVRQATGLLTDLLDLARLETGQQQRVVGSFDAGLLLTELGQSLQPMADEQALELGMAGPDTLVVENDRQLVYRLAQNLLINALKYTHQGNVTVNWGEAGDRWWFAIIDTGPGLAGEVVARLNSNEQARSEATPFEATPFEATRSEATRHRGEGIGLRIVRELASLLEAQLQVRSETGMGTRITVSLPLRYAEA